ncbi:hypothetical protein AAVH_17602 [Aphelenchoides avenae]|nr:hypothetical protein AAVH_17602 [Aphelenchus avenae]
MLLCSVFLIGAVFTCFSEARWIPLCESHGLSSGFLNSLSNEKRRELSAVFHPRSATKRELKEQLAEQLADVPSELQATPSGMLCYFRAPIMSFVKDAYHKYRHTKMTAEDSENLKRFIEQLKFVQSDDVTIVEECQRMNEVLPILNSGNRKLLFGDEHKDGEFDCPQLAKDLQNASF